MKKIVKIRDIRIGEGIPKICVPLVGKNEEELVKELGQLKGLKFDIIEWRMDYYEKVTDIEATIEMLSCIRKLLGEVPLLVTFRSKQEGGEKALSEKAYIELNQAIIKTSMADLIDVELFTGNVVVKEIVELAHDYDVKVVMSNHDFDKTPSKEEIIERLCKMQELDADLPKIAVMPKKTEDVLTLLMATNEMVTKYADRPIITMSMSNIGMISRLAGEVFGSAVTFGAAKVASAPGQIPVEKLYEILHIMHGDK